MTTFYNPYYSPAGGYGGYAAPPNSVPYGLRTQGIFGSIAGGLAGNAIGSIFGGSGSTIGGAAGSILGGFLPFSAGPGLAIAGAEPGGGNGTATAPKPLLIPYDTLDPATRAMIDLGRAATKGLIDQLVEWLKKHQQEADQLGEVIQMTTRAAELFLANDPVRAYTQAQWAYFALERARAQNSALAPLFG